MLDQLSSFHFLRPQWLWLLIAAVVLYLVVLRREDVSKRWRELIAPELLDKLIVGRHRRWRFRPIHSTCLGIALAAIGMAGPNVDARATSVHGRQSPPRHCTGYQPRYGRH